MKEILNKNKNILLIVISIVIIAILFLIVITNTNSGKAIKCEKNMDYVTGITLNENLELSLNKKNKINSIRVNKSINLDNYYQQFDTYRDAIYQHMSEVYQYLNKKDYKVEKNDSKITVSVNIKKNGLVLNNLEISKISEQSRNDLRINSINNLESSSSTYKIGDEYKRDDLIKKLEGLGYTCKK